MYDYLERAEDNRLSINEWFELVTELGYTDNLAFPIGMQEESSNDCWFRNNNLYRPGFSIYEVNKQYKSLIRHFGPSIFAKEYKINEENNTIIVPTEMLSEAMAGHIFANQNLRKFTKLKNIDTSTYLETLEHVKSLKVNETKKSLVQDKSLKLNKKNRMLFYIKSPKDYKLWTTVLENSLQLVSRFKGIE